VRYFFHVMSDGTAYKDEVGRSFSSAEIAKAHATVIATELAVEAENCRGFAVCVIDEQGHEVARVPIARDVT
jgi:hypothetical protein